MSVFPCCNELNLPQPLVQGSNWSVGEELGSGSNDSVHDCVSLRLPGVVLKRGPEERMRREAGLHSKLDHPNVVRLHGVALSQELDEQGRQIAYLALERLNVPLTGRR